MSMAEKEETEKVTEKEAPQAEKKEAAVENKEKPKETRPRRGGQQKVFDVEAWKPKTSIGKKVKAKEITDLDVILDSGQNLLEAEIVDVLIPDIKSELLLIGQSKGKFGGGQRRVFKQTQKKTREGNKPKFATFAVVGNENGYVGVGYGKSKETVPAREKAFRNAKLNMVKIRRGCGSWQCGCGNPHTIPFVVEGKCSSVRLVLRPAPKGTGLCVERECAKILKLAGFRDIWSKSFGQTGSKLNLIIALMKALAKLTTTKVHPSNFEPLGMVEGSIVNTMDEPVVESEE